MSKNCQYIFWTQLHTNNLQLYGRFSFLRSWSCIGCTPTAIVYLLLLYLMIALLSSDIVVYNIWINIPHKQLGFSNRNQHKNYTCWCKFHQTNLRLQSNKSGTLWWIIFITHVAVSWWNNNIFETYSNKKAFISKASLIYVEAINGFEI